MTKIESEHKQQSLLTRIGIAVAIGAFIGLFELGVDEFSVRGFLAAMIPAIAFTLPFAFVYHVFGIQKGIKLALLMIYSSLFASGVWFLLARPKHMILGRFAVAVFVFTAIMLLFAFYANRARQRPLQSQTIATKEPSFIQRAGLKTKSRIFATVFFIFGAVNILCMKGFGMSSFNDKGTLLSYVILVCLLGVFIDLIWFSFVARCPNCHKRVFTLLLAASGKMPIQEIKTCPHCAFPEHIFTQDSMRSLS
jgi:hypothetical protein